MKEIRRILTELVREELSIRQARGAVSPELVVEFVVGAFLTTLVWWLERNPKLTPTDVDAMFRGLVLDGIGPPLGERKVRPAPRARKPARVNAE